MYVGWDTTTPDQVPRDAHLILPYNSGKYDWLAYAHSNFPHAIVQQVSVRADVPGHFLDIERGDAQPDQFRAWHTLSVEKGFWRPGPYGSRSTLDEPALAALIRQLGVEHTRVWGADPTGQPHIPDGWAGCQYLWDALGRNLDESLFRAGSMPPAPAPNPNVELAQVRIDRGTGRWDIVGLPRGTRPLG